MVRNKVFVHVLRDVVVCAGVFAFAVWVYLPTLANEPVYDDYSAVVDNADVRADRTALSSLLQHDFWGKDLNGRDSNTQYRPLTVLTYRHDYSRGCLKGANRTVTAGRAFNRSRACLKRFRTTDLVLHGAATALVYAVARAVAQLPPVSAACAAALFAAHPVHIESVATLYGRADVLCAVLQMAALLLAAAAAALMRRRAATTHDSNLVHAPCAFFLVVVAFALATASVLAKEVGVATALLVPLVYWHGVAVVHSSKTTTRMSPLVGAMGVALAALVVALRRALVHQWTPPMTWFDNPYAFLPATRGLRALSYAHVHARYLAQLLWPRTCSPNYGYNAVPPIAGAHDPRNIASLAAYTAVLTALITATYRRAWTALLLLAWAGAAFLPASNIFFPVGTAFADRLLYLPSAPFCILCAWTGDRFLTWFLSKMNNNNKGSNKEKLTTKTRTRTMAVISITTAMMVATISGMTMVTRTRLKPWETPLALWTSVTKQMPANVVAHNNRAVELLARGRLGPAREAVRRVLAVYEAAESAAVRNHTLVGRVAATEARLARTLAEVAALRDMDAAAVVTSTNAVVAALAAAPTEEHVSAGQAHLTALCVSGALAQHPAHEDVAVDALRQVDHLARLDAEWRGIVRNVVLPRRLKLFGPDAAHTLQKMLDSSSSDTFDGFVE